MRIKELIPNEEIIKGDTNIKVETCVTEPKDACESAALFVIPSVSFDTYSIAEKFARAKARVLITEDSSKFAKCKIPLIEVRSARRAYAFAASTLAGIDYSALTFIGVTGTNGKTSTATILEHILTACGRKVAFIGTGKMRFGGKDYHKKHYSMTSPDPNILYPTLKEMQDNGADTVIMEVSSHALELHKTDPIHFKVGIFTGLSHEHLDFHGNMDNYYHAKERLIIDAECGIINLDDPKGRELYECYKEKCLGIGVIFDAEYRAYNIEPHGLNGIDYLVKSKGFVTKIKLKLPGAHNIYNSLLAFAAANKLGATPKSIKDSLSQISGIEGRLEVIEECGITVIIDYAHTPLALENLLKTVNQGKNTRQKITLVFGCGGERDEEKRPIMARIAESMVTKVIVTCDNPRGEKPEKIIADIVSGFGGGGYGVILDRKTAITYAITHAEVSDIVIIAGKGHERYVCDKDGYRDFDEREIIREALLARKRKANEN